MNSAVSRPIMPLRRWRRLLRLAVAGLTAALLAAGASGVRAQSLNEDQKFVVNQVETYLRSLTTMRGEFKQVGPTGDITTGRFFLRRPGRLRFEYDPPANFLIVSDGIWLVLQDLELKNFNRFPVFDTPLGALVSDEIDLLAWADVLNVTNRRGLLELTLQDRKKPEEGWLRLSFTRPPMRLRQWRVLDAQGGVTTVSLSKIETGIELPQSLFVFDEPERKAFEN